MEQNDLLSSVLNDPEKLREAMQMASSLFGAPAGDDLPPSSMDPPPAAPAAGNGAYDPSAELLQKAMPVISEIARSGQHAVSREKLNLLNAVKPFVASNVSSQIDHGLKLVSLAKMATAALHQFGARDTQEEDTHV